VERPHPATRVCILWEGASRKTSYSGVIWDGSLGVIGGKIKSLEKLRFDSPRSYVTGVMEGHLRWHSVACGYRSGIILDLDGGDRAELELVVRTTLISGPKYGGDAFLGSMRISYRPAEEVRFSVSLAELARGPKVVDIGPLERKVSVALAPERGGPDTARFSFVDSSPQPGINPYWVRVVQSDMEMAWTSPVFVDYAGT
jgi:hypothetical protein